MSNSAPNSKQKRNLQFDFNRNLINKTTMFTTPPQTRARTKEAQNAHNDGQEDSRFGSVNDLSATIGGGNATVTRQDRRPQENEGATGFTAPITSVSDVNQLLEKNMVISDKVQHNNRPTGAVRKIIDTSVPPPKIIGQNDERRRLEFDDDSSNMSEELRSYINKSMAKAQENMTQKIAYAVTTALEQNLGTIVNQIRSEMSSVNSPGSRRSVENNLINLRDNEGLSRNNSNVHPPPYMERDFHSQNVQNHPNQNNLNFSNPPVQNTNIQYVRQHQSENRNQEPIQNNINQNNNQNFRQNRFQYPHTKVYEWGVSYEGTRSQMSVEDFVFRIEFLQNHYQCPWNDVIKDFHRLLNGEAKEWYWLSIKSNPRMNWSQLKEGLLRQFRNFKSDFDLMRMLVERRQNPGESIDEYFMAMTKLRAALRSEMENTDMIKIIKRNVKENISRMIYPMQIWSVEHLREECKQAEEHLSRSYQRAPNAYPNARPTQNRGQVHEVHSEEPQSCVIEEPIEEIVEELIPAPRKADVCWRCFKTGHRHQDCTVVNNRIFCYKCGRDKVVVSNCPDCKARGNSKRNAVQSGELRNPMNPVEK